MAQHTLTTPVAQKRQPRREATWTLKVYQKVKGASKLVHKTNIQALTRDAEDKARVALAGEGYSTRKLSFGPNSTIIVDAIPITPVRLLPRRPITSRSPKLRVTNKEI